MTDIVRMAVSADAGHDNANERQNQSQIIPVGQEPRRHFRASTAAVDAEANTVIGCPAKTHQEPVRSVGKFKTRSYGSGRGVKSLLKDRANTLRVFTVETMGDLTKAEIRVWLAIFNCEFGGRAEIGYSRLRTITKLSRRHVGKAVKSLERQGLLQVVLRGRFQPPRKHQPANENIPQAKGTGCLGQPSVYRIYASPIIPPAASSSEPPAEGLSADTHQEP